MHTMQIFNPLSKQKSLRCKGLHESEACGYGCFITYPREVRINICRQIPSWFGFVTCRHDNVHALRLHPASETRTNHISPPAGDCGSSPQRSAAAPEPSQPLREFPTLCLKRSAPSQACSRRNFLAFCTIPQIAYEPSPLHRSQTPSNRPQAPR